MAYYFLTVLIYDNLHKMFSLIRYIFLTLRKVFAELSRDSDKDCPRLLPALEHMQSIRSNTTDLSA